MRRVFASFVSLAFVASLAAFQPASAATSDTVCTVTSGSEATPNLLDNIGDWNGTVGGNGNATVPYGDIYGSSTDLTEGWINRTGATWTANLETSQWLGLEQNAELYFWWTFGTGPQARRYVAVALARAGVTPIYQYSYGYLAVDPQTGLGTITQSGTTTGATVAGTPGRFSIVIPMNRMGSPQPGDALTDIAIESRILIGSTQVGGLLGVADDSSNADGCLDLQV